MKISYRRSSMKPWLVICLCLPGSLVLGSLLGEIGNLFSLNRLENPVLFLCLIAPLLLGISIALLANIHNPRPKLTILLACLLAWTGFYLTFLWLAFLSRPYSVINPTPLSPQMEQNCSPCFYGDDILLFFMWLFAPIGLIFVALIAYLTHWISHVVSRKRERNKRSRAEIYDQDTLIMPALASEKRLLALPLIRGASAGAQVKQILIYMAIAIAAVLLSFFLSPPFVPLSSPAFLGVGVVQMLIVAVSSFLCGMLFGSWRGMLISFVLFWERSLSPVLLSKTSGGIERFLNYAHLSSLLGDLFFILIATLVVGLIYERRKYVNWPVSFFTILLGETIVTFGPLAAIDPSFVISFVGVFVFYEIAIGALLVMVIESLLQRRQRKQSRM